MSVPTVTQHGTCIAISGLGVLLLGPPGSGKSSLALRLIDEPGYGLGTILHRATLVADDQVVISRHANALMAAAPAALQGKLEVRGLGILACPALAVTELHLAVRLASAATTERMPDPRTITILGAELPQIELDASLAVAPARLRAALSSLVNLTKA